MATNFARPSTLQSHNLATTNDPQPKECVIRVHGATFWLPQHFVSCLSSNETDILRRGNSLTDMKGTSNKEERLPLLPRSDKAAAQENAAMWVKGRHFGQDNIWCVVVYSNGHRSTLNVTESRFTQSSVCVYNWMCMIMREDTFRPVGF